MSQGALNGSGTSSKSRYPEPRSFIAAIVDVLTSPGSSDSGSNLHEIKRFLRVTDFSLSRYSRIVLPTGLRLLCIAAQSIE